MIAWLSTLWGKLIGGAVAVVTLVGGVLLYLGRIKREAREQERQRITAETQRQEIAEREVRDDVEADVAGLDADERRARLQRWAAGRDKDGGV